MTPEQQPPQTPNQEQPNANPPVGPSPSIEQPRPAQTNFAPPLALASPPTSSVDSGNNPSLDTPNQPATKSKKRLIIIVATIALVIIGAGLLSAMMLVGGSSKSAKSPLSVNTRPVSAPIRPVKNVEVAPSATKGFESTGVKNDKKMKSLGYHKTSMSVGDVSTYNRRDVLYSWSKPDFYKGSSTKYLTSIVNSYKAANPTTTISQSSPIILKSSTKKSYSLPCNQLSFYITKQNVKINYYGSVCAMSLQNGQVLKMQTFVINLTKDKLTDLQHDFARATTLQLK